MRTAQPANAASSDPNSFDDRTFVVVGGDLAGAKAVEALREKGFGGRLLLLGDETERPYERPPLSKGYLNGTDERDSVFVHPADWNSEHEVDLRVWTEVTSIDPAAHRIDLAGGDPIGYDKLLLPQDRGRDRSRAWLRRLRAFTTCAGSAIPTR